MFVKFLECDCCKKKPLSFFCLWQPHVENMSVYLLFLKKTMVLFKTINCGSENLVSLDRQVSL